MPIVIPAKEAPVAPHGSALAQKAIYEALRHLMADWDLGDSKVADVLHLHAITIKKWLADKSIPMGKPPFAPHYRPSASIGHPSNLSAMFSKTRINVWLWRCIKTSASRHGECASPWKASSWSGSIWTTFLDAMRDQAYRVQDKTRRLYDVTANPGSGLPRGRPEHQAQDVYGVAPSDRRAFVIRCRSTGVSARFTPAQCDRNALYCSRSVTALYEHAYHFIRQRVDRKGLVPKRACGRSFLSSWESTSRISAMTRVSRSIMDRMGYSASHDYIRRHTEVKTIGYPSCVQAHELCRPGDHLSERRRRGKLISITSSRPMRASAGLNTPWTSPGRPWHEQ